MIAVSSLVLASKNSECLRKMLKLLSKLIENCQNRIIRKI